MKRENIETPLPMVALVLTLLVPFYLIPKSILFSCLLFSTHAYILIQYSTMIKKNRLLFKEKENVEIDIFAFILYSYVKLKSISPKLYRIRISRRKNLKFVRRSLIYSSNKYER